MRIILLICSFLGLFTGNFGWAHEPADGESAVPQKSGFDEPYAQVFGAVIGCAIIGPSTCALIDSSEKKFFVRSWSDWGGGFSYVPTIRETDGRAYHRFEEKVYWSNLTFMMEHRRSFSENENFSASSYRLGYNFDYRRRFIPAFGLGYRAVRNGRNNRAYELWLPVLMSSTQPPLEDMTEPPRLLLMVATTWVFGDQVVSPELNAQVSYRLWSKVFLTAMIGNYLDYREGGRMDYSLGLSSIF